MLLVRSMDLNEIHSAIREEIVRLVGRHEVITFIDARATPLRIDFCDREQSNVPVSGALSELEALFSSHRLACRTHPDHPIWVCAVHMIFGSKTHMSFYYEEDLDIRLETCELRKHVLNEQQEWFRRIEKLQKAKSSRDSQVTSARRLITHADVPEPEWDPNQVSVALRHELELTDERRVLLLKDRGWNSGWAWGQVSRKWFEETARLCVGPDAPFDEHTEQDMAVMHWTQLQQIVNRHGVPVDAAQLAKLPHDVEFSEQLLARIGDDSDALL